MSLRPPKATERPCPQNKQSQTTKLEPTSEQRCVWCIGACLTAVAILGESDWVEEGYLSHSSRNKRHLVSFAPIVRKQRDEYWGPALFSCKFSPGSQPME